MSRINPVRVAVRARANAKTSKAATASPTEATAVTTKGFATGLNEISGPDLPAYRHDPVLKELREATFAGHDERLQPLVVTLSADAAVCAPKADP